MIKMSVNLPSNVTAVSASNTDGVCLTLSSNNIKDTVLVPSKYEVEIHDAKIHISSQGQKDDLMYISTYCKLLENVVTGVTVGFKQSVDLKGVGFRALITDGALCLSIGYSHSVIVNIPAAVNIKINGELNIEISGHSKQSVSQFAAFLTKLRKRDVYKGKGIHMSLSQITLKPGKRK